MKEEKAASRWHISENGLRKDVPIEDLEIKPPVRVGESDTSSSRYRGLWRLSVIVTSLVAILPLIIMTAINFLHDRDANRTESFLAVNRILASTTRNLEFALEEGRDALSLILSENTYEELAKELLGMLLNELPQLREMLAHAIQHSQMDAIWDHAHKIHGSTAYCGVPALRESFKTLESLIKEQNLEAISRQFKIADLEIERLLAFGHEYLHRPWR